jgi:DNA-binding beta-propeller fold protein YncE
MEEKRMRVGQGDYQYDIVPDWGRNGEIKAFGLACGVACDSNDRVYVFVREPQTEVLVFEPDGRLVDRWGNDLFTTPHGIWISPDDHVFLTDMGAHTVLKTTLDGKVLMSIGTPGETGAPGAPFNRPTQVVEAASGDLFVSDGYGQHRVHRFTASGELILSWGEEGTGPGQFVLPHDVRLDAEGHVYIMDRTNLRCQTFNTEGEYQSEQGGLLDPNHQYIAPDGTRYITECGERGPEFELEPADSRWLDGRISVMSADWEVLAQWGVKGDEPWHFKGAPHGIWVDSNGDIYCAEVLVEDGFKKFVHV